MGWIKKVRGEEKKTGGKFKEKIRSKPEQRPDLICTAPRADVHHNDQYVMFKNLVDDSVISDTNSANLAIHTL